MGCGLSSTAGATVSDVHPTSTVAAASALHTNEQQQQQQQVNVLSINCILRLLEFQNIVKEKNSHSSAYFGFDFIFRFVFINHPSL
jgi:hypothetical protein